MRALHKGTPPVHDIGRQRCRRRDAGCYGNAPMQATAEATAGREPQREMTILEVLARLMVCGTNGKGAIGAKAYVTVTTTVLPG